MRKALFTAFLALANLCAVCALDLEFKLEPIVMIPLEEYMGIAPGVIAQGGVDLFNIVTISISLSVSSIFLISVIICVSYNLLLNKLIKII